MLQLACHVLIHLIQSFDLQKLYYSRIFSLWFAIFIVTNHLSCWAKLPPINFVVFTKMQLQTKMTQKVVSNWGPILHMIHKVQGASGVNMKQTISWKNIILIPKYIITLFLEIGYKKLISHNWFRKWNLPLTSFCFEFASKRAEQTECANYADTHVNHQFTWQWRPVEILVDPKVET